MAHARRLRGKPLAGLRIATSDLSVVQRLQQPFRQSTEMGELGGPEALSYAVNKICGHLELFGFRHGAARWNAHIRIDPLKLPPRASAEEPHCRWSIRLVEERVDYEADPGSYVREHGLERETDRQIVNIEAGKYHRTQRVE